MDTLFTLPLIFSAALLSFAHGANDVANAIGPLAAINEAIEHGTIAAKAAIPLWVLLVGAIGISLGLALYGPKLVKTVGSGITELDQMRAFCISMAAAVTVIVASQRGLPVSSTHVTIGAVFGVGFLREYIKANYGRVIETIEEHHEGHDREIVEAYLEKFRAADFEEKGAMLSTAEGKQTGRRRKPPVQEGTQGPEKHLSPGTGQAFRVHAHRGCVGDHGTGFRVHGCRAVLYHAAA